MVLFQYVFYFDNSILIIQYMYIHRNWVDFSQIKQLKNKLPSKTSTQTAVSLVQKNQWGLERPGPRSAGHWLSGCPLFCNFLLEPLALLYAVCRTCPSRKWWAPAFPSHMGLGRNQLNSVNASVSANKTFLRDNKNPYKRELMTQELGILQCYFPKLIWWILSGKQWKTEATSTE